MRTHLNFTRGSSTAPRRWRGGVPNLLLLLLLIGLTTVLLFSPTRSGGAPGFSFVIAQNGTGNNNNSTNNNNNNNSTNSSNTTANSMQCFPNARIAYCVNASIIYGEQDQHPESFLLTLSVDTTGWIGIGFPQGPATGMKYADIIIAYVSDIDGTVVATDRYRNAANQGLPSPDAIQGCTNDVEVVSGHQTSTTTTVTIRRKFVTNDPCDRPVSTIAADVIFAWGATDEIKAHGNNNRGFGRISFTGAPADLEPVVEDISKYLVGTHGIAMSIAWAFFATLGIAMARFWKRRFPAWASYHQAFNAIAGILTLLAFVIIMLKTKDVEAPEGIEVHYFFGWVILLGSLFQPILGVYMHHMKKPSHDDRQEGSVVDPAFPEYLHRWFGSTLWLLGLINIHLGLTYINAHWMCFVVYYGWLTFVFNVFVLNPHPKKKKKNKHQAMTNTDTITTTSSNSNKKQHDAAADDDELKKNSNSNNEGHSLSLKHRSIKKTDNDDEDNSGEAEQEMAQLVGSPSSSASIDMTTTTTIIISDAPTTSPAANNSDRDNNEPRSHHELHIVTTD